MGAGITLATITLDALCLAAQGYTGIGSTRINKGYVRYADNQNFEQTAAAMIAGSQAIASFWLKRVIFAEAEVNPALIVGEVIMSIPKDTSNDMNTYWDYIAGLVASLGSDGSYTVPGAIKPNRVAYSLYKIDQFKTAGLVYFDFGAYGDGGIEFPDP